jgi:tetratricopeptide (TPR) repeat protein
MRPRPLAILAAVPLVLAALLATSRVLADGEDRALALDLFEQGRAFEKSGNYAEALAKFQAAARIMRTFGVLLNAAECEEKLGRTASAWATWREAESVATEANKLDDQALAAKRKNALEPNLIRLTLVVPPGVDTPNLELRRDGVPVPRAAWGSAIPVDPGAHVLEETAPGHKPRRIEVVVPAAGPGPSVTLEALELEPPATRGNVGSRREDFGSGQRMTGWILGAVGLAAVGTGITVALVGQNEHDQAVSTDLAGNTSLAQSQEASANTTKIAGYATLGGGAAFIVSGAILLLTARSPSTAGSALVLLAPWVASSGAGCALRKDW